MKQFPTIQINNDEDVNSRTVNQIQDRIVQALDPLLNLPLSTSNFLEGIVLVVGDNAINHGLGRNLRGWILARVNTITTLYETTSALPAKTLQLTASNPATVSLIVF